ncbi:YncE family protein [Hymenobacter rubripertinctus]|uniref:YncE family protein n=1 Tax=Hymenobacter rubripertinctus TaxID=2029981 RepID=A0A418RAE5_9BACT|nr:YncE family protein [Hymenobacter rubripertinctus]RIY14245.1 YncE family protein [Hymenobacter rubripertinctus]
MKPLSAFTSTYGRLLLGSAAAFSLLACESNEAPRPVTIPTNSVLVVNEGNFQKSNADISVVGRSSGSVLYKAAFLDANKAALGDVAQSLTIEGPRAYVVLNNSNKVQVVSLPHFEAVASIEGLKLPRYFTAASASKGYVTETVKYDGNNGQVSAIDLTTNSVLKTISVGVQPEKLLVVGSRLYVTNSGGNTVTVINTSTDAVEGTIPVGDSPNSLAADQAGNVWVLSGGKVAYNADYSVDYARTTKGSLSRIVPGQLTATTREMDSNQSAPGRLTINGSRSQLYYTYKGAVYTLAVTDAALPATPLIKRRFYGLGIDPQDNTIYGGIGSFTAADKVIRYRSTGAPIDSFTVGIGPNGFVFY